MNKIHLCIIEKPNEMQNFARVVTNYRLEEYELNTSSLSFSG